MISKKWWMQEESKIWVYMLNTMLTSWKMFNRKDLLLKIKFSLNNFKKTI